MSQAKVDKYKKEKQNRAKKIKRRKIRNFILCMLFVFLISMGIGYPLGRLLYKKSYEKRLNNATISSASYDIWAQQYIAEEYNYLFSADADSDTTATPSDAVSE